MQVGGPVLGVTQHYQISGLSIWLSFPISFLRFGHGFYKILIYANIITVYMMHFLSLILCWQSKSHICFARICRVPICRMRGIYRRAGGFYHKVEFPGRSGEWKNKKRHLYLSILKAIWNKLITCTVSSLHEHIQTVHNYIII